MAINYPYRVFRYQVEIDGISRAGFSEVSGMSSSVDAVEYREGDDLRNTPRKLPGLTKFGNVTLRWGVSDDQDFLTWLYSVSPTNNAPPTGLVRHTVTITLSAPNGALPALLDVPIVKETGGTPLGTGPYVLTGEGDSLALEARTGWWKGEKVPLERIPLYNVREADGMIHAFDTQEISLVTVDITGSNALGYSGTYEVWDYATSVMLYIGYNTASGPCADQDLRKALSYAV